MRLTESESRQAEEAQEGFLLLTRTIPANDDAVIEQVDFDVLDSDGLIEALRDQQSQ